MGLIGRFFGGGRAAGTVAAVGDGIRGVAEVFVPSATRRMELSAEAQSAALLQFGQEFSLAPQGRFDRFVNALNRLPRPMFAFGTVGMFAHAMADPAGFARRMTGLAAVPEPLWWLLGAVVAFYFGARETHYFRARGLAVPAPAGTEEIGSDNPALADWRVSQG
jgi:hypothetical protein